MKTANRSLNSRQMMRKFGTNTKEVMGLIDNIKTMQVQIEKELLEEMEKTGKEEIIIKKEDLLKVSNNSIENLLDIFNKKQDHTFLNGKEKQKQKQNDVKINIR